MYIDRQTPELVASYVYFLLPLCPSVCLPNCLSVLHAWIYVSLCVHLYVCVHLSVCLLDTLFPPIS